MERAKKIQELALKRYRSLGGGLTAPVFTSVSLGPFTAVQPLVSRTRGHSWVYKLRSL